MYGYSLRKISCCVPVPVSVCLRMPIATSLLHAMVGLVLEQINFSVTIFVHLIEFIFVMLSFFCRVLFDRLHNFSILIPFVKPPSKLLDII